MIFHWIDVKPLSANEAYAPKAVRSGARVYATSYKTVKYQLYEKAVRSRLKNIEFDFGDTGELVLCMRVRYATAASDVDNCVKPFLDILQRFYGFNDNRVYVLNVVKEVVGRGKGKAGIEFYLDTRENYMKEKQYVRPYTPYGAILPRQTTKTIVFNYVKTPSTDNREEQLYALDKQSRLAGSVGQGVHYALFDDGSLVVLRPNAVRGDLIPAQDSSAVYIRIVTPDGTAETCSDLQEEALDATVDMLEGLYGKLATEVHEGFKV